MEHKTKTRADYVKGLGHICYAICSCGWQGPSRIIRDVALGDAERHRVKAASKTAEKGHANG